MRGAYYQYCRMNGVGRYTDAVEAVNNKRKVESVARLALKKEQAELKRARIMNEAEPEYKNGHPKDAEKGRSSFTTDGCMPFKATKRSKRSA